MANYYLGINKVKRKTGEPPNAGNRKVEIVARHNLREIVAERGADSHIDVERIKDNYIIAGASTAAGVADYEHELLADACLSKKLRKDAVRALELVFSLPPDTVIDHRAYFVAAFEWARQYYDAPILSAVVHLDESAPHCHVVILPLVDGKMDGSRLFGNHDKFIATLEDFYQQVASKFGLPRQVPHKRISPAIRQGLAASMLAAIKANTSALNEPAVKDALIALMAANPELLAIALGIDIPEPKKKKPQTFVEIMTKPQKPDKPKPKGFTKSNPKGFAHDDALQKKQSLSCVGFQNNSPVISPPERPQPAYQRIKETDHPAESWDWETGSHIQSEIVRNRQTMLNESGCVTWH
jgi:hypothetical protein